VFYFSQLFLVIFHPARFPLFLSGEYISYSPLIIPSNIHLQCLCSTKKWEKTTSRRQYGIKNYFYSDSLTRPRNVKNKYRLFWGTSGICVYSHHISTRCLKITYTYWYTDKYSLCVSHIITEVLLLLSAVRDHYYQEIFTKIFSQEFLLQPAEIFFTHLAHWNAILLFDCLKIPNQFWKF
jgi:hypothetical protein